MDKDKQTSQPDFGCLCEQIAAELLRLATAEFVDPAALAGYMTPEAAAAELARRSERVRQIVTRLLAGIEAQFGVTYAA